MVDNLVDLSHIQFLRKTSLGAASDQDADISIRRTNNNVFVDRWTMDTAPAPFYALALGTNANVDRWQKITYTPPSHIVIDAGSALAGTGARDGDRSCGAEIYSNHTMTPETETSTHYFWHHARNFRLEDNDFTEQLRSVFTSALNEDVVAIAAAGRKGRWRPPPSSMPWATPANKSQATSPSTRRATPWAARPNALSSLRAFSFKIVLPILRIWCF